jgi:hypothetical protein
LAGLVVSQLEGVQTVVFSDYDHGSLKIIEENIQLNHHSLSHLSPPPQLRTQYLEWGQPCPETAVFDLLIGSDLLYCLEVVSTLFSSVNSLLRLGTSPSSKATFILCTSFALGKVLLLNFYLFFHFIFLFIFLLFYFLFLFYDL